MKQNKSTRNVPQRKGILINKTEAMKPPIRVK